MSYQVIARKWRPQSFEELVGQPHIAQGLLNALRSGRLPHAMLFSGPRGTGKTSTARIVAKSLRCTQAKDFVPCNECMDCIDITQSRSLDVLEIDGASHNGVDAIRELREGIGFMPTTGSRKIYIIDEVHMLSSSAFNALLKTLEEPPAHVIFMFATTEAHKIPITILSRCQRFDLRKISTPEIVNRLIYICTQEKVQFEEAAIWAIARQSAGSMRDSQSLLDQALTFCQGNLKLQMLTDVLGLTDRELLNETLKALVTHDCEKVFQIVAKIDQKGLDPKVFLQDFLKEIRNALFAKMHPKDIQQLVDLSESELVELNAIVKDLLVEDLHLQFDMALKGFTDLTKAQLPMTVLEMVLLRMATAPAVKQIQQLTQQFSQQPRANTPVPSSVQTRTPTAAPPQKKMPAKLQVLSEIPNLAPTKKPETPPQTQQEALPSGTPQQKWEHLVLKMKNSNPMLAAKLEHMALIQIQDGVCILGVKSSQSFLANQIQNSPAEEILKVELGQIFQQPVRLQFEVHGTQTQTAFSPKETALIKKHVQEDQIKKQIQQHPTVQAVQKIFNAEIVSTKENP